MAREENETYIEYIKWPYPLAIVLYNLIILRKIDSIIYIYFEIWYFGGHTCVSPSGKMGYFIYYDYKVGYPHLKCWIPNL